MRHAYIVSAVRTPVGKAGRGRLRAVRPDDLGALVLREALARVPALPPEELDDVILGCAMPEGAQGMNVGRIAMLRAGIPCSVPAMTVNRFCASGLETIAMAAHRIQLGVADVILAGGTESMSQVPMGGRSPPAESIPRRECPRCISEYGTDCRERRAPVSDLPGSPGRIRPGKPPERLWPPSTLAGLRRKPLPCRSERLCPAATGRP